MKPANEAASVRPARPDDVPAVRAISAASPASAGWSQAQFEAEAGSPRALFLVAGEGEPAGYVVAWVVGDEAQILDVAVHPGRRRRGLGRALLTALAGAARARGCRRMTLEVSAANPAARALYERFGFKVVGGRPKFYNDGADAVLMDLNL